MFLARMAEILFLAETTRGKQLFISTEEEVTVLSRALREMTSISFLLLVFSRVTYPQPLTL